MSALNYYERLMRRAQATAGAEAVRVRDPFDATAPWLLNESDPASSRLSAEPGLSPAVPPQRLPAPEAPSLPGQQDERAAGFTIESIPATAADRDLETRPAPIDVFSTVTVRHAETPGIAGARVTPLEPSEPPPVIRDPPGVAMAIDRDDRPAVVTVFRDGEVAASPRPPRETPTVVPLTPSPPVPLATAWPQEREETSSPAPPPPVSTHPVERPPEHRRPAPPPPPQVIIVRDRTAGAWSGTAAADQDLLRGPTHQLFGIGQV